MSLKDRIKKVKTPTESDLKQRQIVNDWTAFSKTAGYKDIMEYIDRHRTNLISFAEERAMPSPDGKGMVSLNNETASSLLQNARGMNIVRTYIRLRSEDGVVQNNN